MFVIPESSLKIKKNIVLFYQSTHWDLKSDKVKYIELERFFENYFFQYVKKAFTGLARGIESKMSTFTDNWHAEPIIRLFLNF